MALLRPRNLTRSRSLGLGWNLEGEQARVAQCRRLSVRPQEIGSPGLVSGQHQVARQYRAGILLLLIAIVWTGVNLVVAQSLLDEPMPMPLVLIPILLLGLAFFFAALKMILHQRVATIDRDVVTIDQRGWFRTERWRATLDTYPGVLRKKITYGRNKKSYDAFLALLTHADRSMTAVLAATRNEAKGREQAEAYARWLDKPALEETADGYLARDPDDLDKPLAQLVAEGKIVSSYRSGSTPPAEVRVEHGDDLIVVSFPKGAVSMWFWAVVAGVAAAAAFLIVALATDFEARVAGGGVAFLVLAGVLFLATRQTPRGVRSCCAGRT